MDVRKNIYQVETQINDNLFLHYCSYSDKYILLDSYNHNLYDTLLPQELNEAYPALFSKLINNSFYVESSFNELESIYNNRNKLRKDLSLYHIVVNTTLGCNLNCWYCYEDKSNASSITQEVVDAIKKNIELHYSVCAYSTLKISFFGGEPFLNKNAIEELLTFADDFCEKRGVSLIADFTTNGTLINGRDIAFLKKYECSFQITLDGTKEQHNRIKKSNDGLDAYSKTVSAIRSIITEMPKSKVWVRINYDALTLKEIRQIEEDIDILDRNRLFVILRKVWQVKASAINKSDLLQAIQLLFEKGFVVDFYPLTIKRFCFAERLNQVLVNVDGGIFKCSTVPSFSKRNSLGKLDISTGKVQWDEEKISYLKKNYHTQCEKCGLYGACVGSCNKILSKDKNSHFCILDEIGLDMGEYLMYNFKLSLLANRMASLSINTID